MLPAALRCAIAAGDMVFFFPLARAARAWAAVFFVLINGIMLDGMLAREVLDFSPFANCCAVCIQIKSINIVKRGVAFTDF